MQTANYLKTSSKNFLIVLLALLVFVSCKKTDSGNKGSTLPAISYKNISYGSDPAENMDIYLPAGRTSSSTKVMIMIHGGGWASGDKTDFDSYIPRLQTELPDYAFLNINYRLYNGASNRFPAQENDVESAVNFLVAKSGEYNISQKLVLLGASAGGHLALLQAYKHLIPIRARVAVSLFGPTDLIEFYNNPPSPAVQQALEVLIGYSPSQNIAVYQQSSPIYFVNQQTAPTLIFHGNSDPLVPVSQSTLLKNKLDASGVINQLVIYPNEGHGWTGASLDDTFLKIKAFLSTNVK